MAPGEERILLPMQEMQEIQFRYLGWEDPLEEEMRTHSSILAWRIPLTEYPGGLHGVTKSQTQECVGTHAQYMYQGSMDSRYLRKILSSSQALILSSRFWL